MSGGRVAAAVLALTVVRVVVAAYRRSGRPDAVSAVLDTGVDGDNGVASIPDSPSTDPPTSVEADARLSLAHLGDACERRGLALVVTVALWPHLGVRRWKALLGRIAVLAAVQILILMAVAVVIDRSLGFHVS